MEFISSINDAVNSFVWGAPAIIMMMGLMPIASSTARAMVLVSTTAEMMIE